MYEDRAMVDTRQLEEYRGQLCGARNRMQSEIETLTRAYRDAEWNDMVSEKVGHRLNAYIDAYNGAMEKLDTVISAVTEMCEYLDEYKSVVD